MQIVFLKRCKSCNEKTLQNQALQALPVRGDPPEVQANHPNAFPGTMILAIPPPHGA
jgi:hypothetical protein